MRSRAMWLQIRILLVPVPSRWLAFFTAPWCNHNMATVVKTSANFRVGAAIPAPVSIVPAALHWLATASTALGCLDGRQAGPLLCSEGLVVCRGCCNPRVGHLLASRRIWLVTLAVVRVPWLLLLLQMGLH